MIMLKCALRCALILQAQQARTLGERLAQLPVEPAVGRMLLLGAALALDDASATCAEVLGALPLFSTPFAMRPHYYDYWTGRVVTHNQTKSFDTVLCVATPKRHRTSAMSLFLKQSLRDTRTPQRLVRASLPMVSSNPRIAARGLTSTS